MPWLSNRPDGRWAATVMWPDGLRETVVCLTKFDAEEVMLDMEDDLAEELEEGR